MREIKIISLERRPWFERILSINDWRVAFMYEGKKYEINAWAGSEHPNAKSLLYDIGRNLDKEKERENQKIPHMDKSELIGREIDLDRLWDEDWDQKYL